MRLLSLLLCYLSYITPGAAQVQFNSWTLEQARTEATKQDKLFLLYFTADWCAPCSWMETHTWSDSDLTQYLGAHYLAVEVDMDKGSAALLRQQFEVTHIPSILVFNAAGQLIDRQQGSASATELSQWLRSLDQPQHHIAAVREIPAPTNVLNSPSPRLSFSRPPLGKATALPALSRHAPPASPAAPLVAQAAQETFIPRDGGSYRVLLTDIQYTYSEAIQQVPTLERKYGQRAELQPSEGAGYRISLGHFERWQEAQDFLNYLQRNNRQGQILTLGR